MLRFADEDRVAQPIEEYALIGDCETSALVGRNGSIDWLCWPDFSSPACFAALIGTVRNGRWSISPRGGHKRVTRRYRDHTLILETTFKTESGVLQLTDFMPPRGTHSDIVRIAHCTEGQVAVEMELRLRFDYGRTVPWTESRDTHMWTATAGTSTVFLCTHQKIRTEDGTAFAEFVLTKGEQRSFALTHIRSDQPPSRQINIEKALKETQRFWTAWCAISTYDGPWKDAVERSLITLKALTYRPSGGIVAAPTTSLPERVGGDRNWDYRYCWLRDGAFTLESLLSVGYHKEATAWQQWLLQVAGPDVREMQTMYGVRGERHLPECDLPWLRGYINSRPVRAGNSASEQLQLDMYGEVADAIATMNRDGIQIDPRLPALQRDLTNYIAVICDRPSSGLWERRNSKAHYIYSEMMAWLALHHGVNTFSGREISRWKEKRDRLHQQICRRGFNRELGSFVQAYGSQKLDASALLLPMFGFLPYKDERVCSTMKLIEQRLTRGGLVFRNLPAKAEKQESAFIACSFWMVQNLVGVGRRAEGERLFERILKLRNDVGLLAEEYDPERERFLGNFPQAFSHIALINAARMLSREG